TGSGNSSGSSDYHIALKAASDLDTIRDIFKAAASCTVEHDNLKTYGTKYIFKIVHYAQGGISTFKYLKAYQSEDGTGVNIRGKIRAQVGGSDMEIMSDYIIINIRDTSITKINTKITVNEHGNGTHDYVVNISGIQ
ncbi:MAG: hypothetical protein JKX73_04970, partial [Flavobacteriales bacterium]|nr:hypothetical protein [Flavobacteriales bacterium]